MSNFIKGDIVTVRGHDSDGVIMEGPSSGPGGPFYLVFIDNENLYFPSRDLDQKSARSYSPVNWVIEEELSDPDSLARSLTYLKLTGDLTDLIYSLGSSKTDFRVHQFKPVVKLIEQQEGRLLLADEVGLGKTIEAGLVWSELDARHGLRRVLVLCPSSLQDKWQFEMYRRFDRDLELYDKRKFLEFLDRYQERPEATTLNAISTYTQLRHEDVLTALVERPALFDLVIIDEAHNMRNRNTNTHSLGELLSLNTQNLLLLTATPVNLGSNDLLNLLNLLHPNEFDNPDTFKIQLEPNVHINQAVKTLRNTKDPDQVLDELGQVERTQLFKRFTQNPIYKRLIARFSSGESIKLSELPGLQNDLQGLNTLNSTYVRTRKVDLPDVKTVRRAHHLKVEFSSIERELYAASVDLVVAIREEMTDLPKGLAVVMPARQASSSLPVMKEYAKGLLEDYTLTFTTDSEESLEHSGEIDYFDEPLDLHENLETKVQKLIQITDALGDTDTKYAELLNAIQKFIKEGNDKILLFSFFRRTLTYLQERLIEDGIKCTLIDGSVKPRDRSKIISDFRNNTDSILLSSQIGSEGLDFEFCSVVINYDLPWNPMQLEQRIGRIDRYGQISPVVNVVNFEIAGTIDTDIFLRLYKRIGIFESSVGELEPILGSLISDLNKRIISKELSQKEQDAAFDSFEVAVQMEKENLHRFEDDKKNLVGVDDFIETEIQDIQNSNRYITPNELKRYINGFLTSECPGSEIRGDSESSFMTGSPALTEVLRNHTDTQPSEAFIDLMLKCETGSSFEVTFDSNESVKETQLFVHNRHPLVRCVTSGYKEAKRKLPKVGLIELESEKLHNTDWLLFVFHFETTGLYARRELFPVAVEKKKDGQVSTQLGKYALSELSTENPRSIQQNKLPSLQIEEVEVAWDGALSEAQGHQFSLNNELNERAETYITARVSSLEAGLSTRVERLKEISENPELNEKIRRMRQGQIINLTTTTKSKITELESLRDVTVSFKPVLAALLTAKA